MPLAPEYQAMLAEHPLAQPAHPARGADEAVLVGFLRGHVCRDRCRAA